MPGFLMRSTFMSLLSRRRARWLVAVPVAALLATAAGVDAVEAAAPDAAVSAPVQTQDAAGFIDRLGERALAAVAGGADPAQRVGTVAELLEEAADLDLIARLVLGRHWQQASGAQRQEYLRLFRSYARDSLARRFDDYAGGGTFSVTGSRPVGPDDTAVSTRVTLAGGKPPVAIDWRVRREGDRFVVIDVVAEGVSLLVTNRAQFESVISSRGLDGLLAQMRAWHEAGSGPAA
jgi:phospholipid transport system substrate-binding protein